MPKIVDHEKRREEIVEAFLDLVERNGLSGASSRALAAQLGISNSLLWRYFDDMDALVERAYLHVVSHTNARIEKSVSGLTGLQAVYVILDELLPVTSASKAEARIVVQFWAAKARDDKSYVEPHNCWRTRIREHLEEACQAGELRKEISVFTITDILMAIVGNAQIEFAMSRDDAAALATRDLARAVVYLHE